MAEVALRINNGQGYGRWTLDKDRKKSHLYLPRYRFCSSTRMIVLLSHLHLRQNSLFYMMVAVPEVPHLAVPSLASSFRPGTSQ